MHPFFYFFNMRIPAFGTMITLAGLVSFCLLMLIAKRRKFPADDTLNYFLMCLLGGLGGAILLHAILAAPNLIIDWQEQIAPLPLMEKAAEILAHLGGMIFYGGFIGAALAVLLYSKLAKVPLLQYLDIIAPVAPVAHAIGRVGCLLGGCCYGIEVAHDHPLAIVYPPASLAAPPGIPLLAVPLIESFCNLLIAGVLFIFSRNVSGSEKKRIPGRVVALYALLYAPVRFVLEFFRGDEIRGVYGGVSTSQIISIVIFAAGAALFLFAPKLETAASESWEEYERKQKRLIALRKRWDETHGKT